MDPTQAEDLAAWGNPRTHRLYDVNYNWGSRKGNFTDGSTFSIWCRRTMWTLPFLAFGEVHNWLAYGIPGYLCPNFYEHKLDDPGSMAHLNPSPTVTDRNVGYVGCTNWPNQTNDTVPTISQCGDFKDVRCGDVAFYAEMAAWHCQFKHPVWDTRVRKVEAKIEIETSQGTRRRVIVYTNNTNFYSPDVNEDGPWS